MTEPVFVAKNLDNFWVGMKGLSNVSIACFLRNFFKEST